MPKNTVSAFVIRKNDHFELGIKSMKEEKITCIKKRTVLKSGTPPLAQCYQSGKIKLHGHNYSPKKQRVYPCLL